jgi:DNA-binding NtrC family response regulator
MTSSNDRDLNEGALRDDLNGLRVLVVEDSWEVATGLARILKAWEVDVLGPVATTADALRLICGRTVDAALVDIHLRDGEYAHGLIDRLHDQGIRVVVISGYSDVSVARGKVAATLRKPMEPDLLLQSLRSGQKKDTKETR